MCLRPWKSIIIITTTTTTEALGATRSSKKVEVLAVDREVQRGATRSSRNRKKPLLLNSNASTWTAR